MGNSVFKSKYTLSVIAVLATLSPAQFAKQATYSTTPDPSPSPSETPGKKRNFGLDIRKDFGQHSFVSRDGSPAFKPLASWEQEGSLLIRDFKIHLSGNHPLYATFNTTFQASGKNYFYHLFGKPIEQATYGEVQSFLSGFMVSDANIPLSSAYLFLTLQTTREGVQDALKQIDGTLSWEEKITFTRYIGKIAENRYQNSRTKFSEMMKFKGIAPEDIILNLKNPTKSELGVCRDIAIAQAMVMETFGFQDVYLLSYESTQNHVTVISRNPLNKNELMHINYDDQENTDLSLGREALKRFEDTSKYYWIFDSKGKSVAQLPTEITQLLNEGAGVSIELLDPFLTYSQGSLARAYTEVDGKNGVHRASSGFAGQTRFGENLYGVSQTWQKGNAQEDKSSSTVLLSLSHIRNEWNYKQNRSGDLFDKKHKMQGTDVRAAVWKSTNSRWIPLSKKSDRAVEMRLGAHHAVEFSAGYKQTRINEKVLRTAIPTPTPPKPYEYDEHGTTYNARLQSDLGIDARKKLGENGSEIRFRAAAQMNMGFENVSKSIPNRIYPNLYYSYISGKVMVAEDTSVNFKAAYGKRVFGDQALISAGVQHPYVSATVGVQGYLGKNSLPIYPGARREGFLNLQAQPIPALQVNLSVQQPIKMIGSNKGQVNLGVKAKIGAKKRRR